jgi:hypothetical protein
MNNKITRFPEYQNGGISNQTLLSLIADRSDAPIDVSPWTLAERVLSALGADETTFRDAAVATPQRTTAAAGAEDTIGPPPRWRGRCQ